MSIVKSLWVGSEPTSLDLTANDEYLLIGLHDLFQKKHSMLRNFPVFGWGRYFMEFLRPKIYQYFVESDIDGTPISRIHRSLVYQRAKGDIATMSELIFKDSAERNYDLSTEGGINFAMKLFL